MNRRDKPLQNGIVLLLAAVEGFTCKEIGMMLGVPIGTVISRLSRGRCEVRRALQPKSSTDDVTKGATV
jgi:RNA polymerase sigma-70 factor (ECF subfamily)